MRVKKLSGIVMRIAVILLCLVLFSAHLASGMFARYSTTAEGQDTARTAKYNVQIVPDPDYQGYFDFDAVGNCSYPFKITNLSEVPVYVKLAADASFDMDDLLFTPDADVEAADRAYIKNRVLKDVKLNDKAAVASSNNTHFEFPDVDCYLKPGESKNYTITAVTDIAAIYSENELIADVRQNADEADYNFIYIDFDIYARSVQVD